MASLVRRSRWRLGFLAPARRAALTLLLLALPLGLAACTMPSLNARRTVTLTPTDLVTRWHYEYYNYDSGLCSFGAERSLPAPPGTVLVGADNYFKGGSGLFPCIQKNDYAYRAGVRFYLADYQRIRPILIEKATLSWTIQHAIVRDQSGGPSGVASGPDVTNCVGALMEGTRSPYTADGFLPAVPYRSGKGDVTSLVQSWIVNGDPNWGFVLVGLNESYSRNNAACLNTISNIRLTITYRTSS